MIGVARTSKVCATCKHWHGIRKLSKLGNIIHLNSQGQCLNPFSFYFIKYVEGFHFCNRWMPSEEILKEGE